MKNLKNIHKLTKTIVINILKIAQQLQKISQQLTKTKLTPIQGFITRNFFVLTSFNNLFFSPVEQKVNG